jgi:hypothetical protein
MLNTKDQRERLSAMIATLFEIDACKELFEGTDDKYYQQQREELEWRYKKQMAAISRETLNTDNARVFHQN